MANAGYGNHVTTDPKVAEAAEPDAAARKPGPQGTPAGDRPVPSSGGTGPSGSPDHPTPPTPGGDGRRDEATPGTGALPSGGAGNDVDPGTG